MCLPFIKALIARCGMNETVMTLHPDDAKKGVKIEKSKYDLMRNTILEILKRNGAMPFMELAVQVEDQLQGKFDGSIMWYYTTVKLDLEARGEIRRVLKSKPQKVELCMP